jgi:biopolymer transport protein ExbB
MNNPYGVAAMLEDGDWVTKGIAITLLIMSVASWTVMAVKTVQLMRLRRLAANVNHRFWHAHSFEDALKTIGEPNQNPFRTLAEEARNAVAHHAQHGSDLHAQLNVSDWLSSCLRRTMEDATAKLQAGLAVLATIGSTAPFVGLFGTVWGIYNALVAIGVSGVASIDKVAGPVGEALIMTAFGLFVAIPAVMGFNALTRGNKALVMRFSSFAHDLHAYFITGARVTSAQHEATTNLRAVGER